jgi:hypothetical protein
MHARPKIQTINLEKLKSIPKDTKPYCVELECMQDQKLESTRTKKLPNHKKQKSSPKYINPNV